MELAIPAVAPAIVLSAVLGAFHTSLYVVVRGAIRIHLLLVLPAAILGAFAGQALGARVGDPFRLGDFSLTWASLLAWVGIIIVAVASTLGPTRADG